MKTSEKIRQLRIEKGLSQEALGEIVGVKKAAINKYETGRVINIKKSMLVKLAEKILDKDTQLCIMKRRIKISMCFRIVHFT